MLRHSIIFEHQALTQGHPESWQRSCNEGKLACERSSLTTLSLNISALLIIMGPMDESSKILLVIGSGTHSITFEVTWCYVTTFSDLDVWLPSDAIRGDIEAMSAITALLAVTGGDDPCLRDTSRLLILSDADL